MGDTSMVQFTLATPLGIPVHPSDFDQALRELERAGRLEDVNRTAVNEVMDALFRDGTLKDASGRWRSGRPDPDQFVPGDIAAIRAIAGDALVRGLGAVSLQRATTLHLRSARGGGFDVTSDREALLVQLDPERLLDFPVVSLMLVDLYRAVPYFVPTTAAMAVLASRPPHSGLQTALRLPFERTLVLFGADLELDPASYPWPQGLSKQELDRFELVGELMGRGGHLSGLVLLADDDGYLRDDVVWVVAANPDPRASWPASLDRVRGLVRGFRSAATLGPLVTNVAAAVAWAIWREPPSTPDLPANPTSRQDPDGPRSRRASPVSHLRSGHFRNVRVGPRDGFHHEPRWIPPTWVRGNLDSTDQRLVVRRVPPPAVWAQPEVGDGRPGADSGRPQGPLDPEVTSPRSPEIGAAGHQDPFEPGFG